MRTLAIAALLLPACNTEPAHEGAPDVQGDATPLEIVSPDADPTVVPPAAVEPTAPLVDLIVSTESLCPCAGQWTHDLVNTVLPAVGEIVDVQRYVDGTANDDGSVWVFHGEAELLSQKHEVCVQDQAEALGMDGMRTSLQWTACVNGACTGPGGFLGLEYCEGQGDVGRASGADQAAECADALGLDWQQIVSCGNSDEGLGLHWDSSLVGNNAGATYGLLGLPVVYLEGERISTFWDCSSYSTGGQALIDQICDAYTGEDPPEACL